MLSAVYHGRALPLCWVVVKAPKGHFPQDTHCALLAQVQALIPQDAQVTFLGDGEFDGTELQAQLRKLKWSYVCRTASNILVLSHPECVSTSATSGRRAERWWQLHQPG